MNNEQIIAIACMTIPELLELQEALTTTIAIKREHGEEEASPKAIDGYQMQPESIWGIGE